MWQSVVTSATRGHNDDRKMPEYQHIAGPLCTVKCLYMCWLVVDDNKLHLNSCCFLK